MANGRPRSSSTELRQTLPQTVNALRASWPDFSSTEAKVGSRLLERAKDTAGDGFVVEERNLEEPEAPRSTHLTRDNRYAEPLFFLDEDSRRMVNSPAQSWNGSIKAEDASRNEPLNASHSPPPPSPRLLAKDSSRQDSAYESIKGNPEEQPQVDSVIQATNIRARERVEILRGRVLRTRRDINEKREELQILRENFRDATAKLMRVLNEFMVQESNGDRAALFPHYEQVRASQDQLGPAEDDYDILEIRLNREEYELEQEEARFYTSNNIVLRLHPDDKLDEQLTPHIKPYEPEDTEYGNLDLENELVKQYLAAVAEADHLGEQLDSLEDAQYRMSQELSFRMRHKVPVAEGTTTFLFEFPQAHKKLLKQLHDAEDKLYLLRGRCIAEQLFTKTEYIYVPHNALVDEINESVNDVRDRSPLRTAVLHHNVAAHIQDAYFEDKKNYVNSWILDWIQDSSLDALRLKDTIYSQYPKDGKELRDDDWSELALDFWDLDKAGQSANQKHVLSTMDAILGGTGTSGYDLSLMVDPGEEVFESFIMGSEAASYTTQRMGSGTRQEEVSSDAGLVILMGPRRLQQVRARRSSL